MTPKEYILSTFENLRAPIKSEDIGDTPLEEAIYVKLMSKKFRKLKAGDECVQIAKEAIKVSVKNNQPIRIFQMFGGNKLWRFEEAPEIEWAELFSLTYFIEWSRLIASVYAPGVIFEYFSQDISVESLNNVPRSETDKYSQTFRELLEFIEPYLPQNVKVVYKRHYELFDNPDGYSYEIEEAKKKILSDNNGELPKLDEHQLTATELNVKLKPGQNEDPQWRERVELEHQAIFITPTLKKYTSDPTIIWTCPTYYPDSVVTGSTKRSYAKFWAAVGALQKEGDNYAELVLTPKQLETTKFTWEDIDIPGLPGNNFKKIRIIE